MFAILENGSVETMLRYRLTEVLDRTSIRYSDRSVKNKDDRDDPTKLQRDLAELCVNCVDDRRAFPIAWKPYDL